MKIAVSYENGNIFQHFGHTERFKIYEIRSKEVIYSEIVDTNCGGHGALAGFLVGNDIDVVICGGIGSGAHIALLEAGIAVCAGQSGNADEAVEAFLRGELVNSGANCDHHGEGHTCGHGDSGSCGDSSDCGGCAGCPSEPPIEGKNVGRVCLVHYRGTFDDGTQFDSSYDRGEPLEFECGSGMMIRGFDAAVAGMDVGDKIDIHLTPAEAYGERNPGAVIRVPISQMAGSEELEVGQRVYLRNVNGQPVPVTVTEKDDETITFDANHEMAGKELNFTIELVKVM